MTMQFYPRSLAWHVTSCQLWTNIRSPLRPRVYLGAVPTATLGVADTSVPSPPSSWAVCASRTTSCPRTSPRRPRWPEGDIGRSSAASGSTPRFPCWTRTPPRLLCAKAPSLPLESSDSTFSPSRWELRKLRKPPPPLTPRAFPRRKHKLRANTRFRAHYCLFCIQISTLSPLCNFKVAAQIFAWLTAKLWLCLLFSSKSNKINKTGESCVGLSCRVSDVTRASLQRS